MQAFGMKRCFFICLVLGYCLALQAQRLAPVDSSSTVQFKIKNLGFNVTGSFKGLDGRIYFDPVRPDADSFHVSVDVNTINTGIDMRDDHLKSENYFDVKNHPQMVFISDKVTRGGKPGTFFVSGKLTIKGVTKAISFPFNATAQGKGYLFTGEFKINRKDFGVGGGSTIADNLTVLLSVFAKNRDEP